MPRNAAERYASWLDRNRVGIIVLSLLVTILGGFFAARMTIKSDLTNLLPQTKRSVKDLVALQQRARPFGTVQVVLEVPPDKVALRERAAKVLAGKLAKLDPSLVAQFSQDDGPLRRYAWNHRFMFANLSDLEAAKRALEQRIERAKRDANVLFVDLDDEEQPDPKTDKLAELQQKLADAERLANDPPKRIAKDGTLQLFTVQTTFPASDAHRAQQLLRLIEAAIAETEAQVGEGVSYGFAGNITLSMHEHDSVLEGMTLSVVITVLLVGLGLLLYYRSGKLVLAMLYALAVGVAGTFAFAWAVVGHLNVMTAFLVAIVVGTGINAGLVLVARFQEELRASPGDAPAALGAAIAGTMRGTLAATATAGVAYASLLVTDFRGFRQFGAIAGLGMALTWITSFTVLPAVLSVLARAGLVKSGTPPAIGNVLARMLPVKRLGLVMVVTAVITAVSLVVTIVFIVKDPFTHDWRDLQSSTRAIRSAQGIERRVGEKLDTSALLSGQAFQLAIALDRRDQVKPLVDKLRADDAKRPEAERWIKDVRSIDDLIPQQQHEKAELLRGIEGLLNDPKLQASLSDQERADLDRVRPRPADLEPVTDADVPHELAWPFIEKDGSIGRLVVVRGASRFKSFNVDHRLEFAGEVKRLELPPGALVAGEAMVVADIIEVMEADAPNMIVFALAGSIVAVFLVIGLRRHGLVTLACGMGGVIVMIAACASVGLKVHFLDLIALPITIGIGIDYAVNIAARDRQDGQRGPQHLLRTIGGTVLMCSFTTAVGYGTLMLSANGGIRAFGEAALLGEITCLAIAVMACPAWLTLLRQRDVRRQVRRNVSPPLPGPS
ncbi:MAG: MMPL family transporter [Myxococcales bacterium]|nr:MMPL family transporter [Myxococcales bacterium]